MKETDIECGHTKTTLHARGVNKSRKIIAFSHLISTNFIKKETPAHMFSCEFCKIFKNTFSTEHLQATASGLNVLAKM